MLCGFKVAGWRIRAAGCQGYFQVRSYDLRTLLGLLGSCRTKFYIFLDTWAQYQYKKIFFYGISAEPSLGFRDNLRIRVQFLGFTD